MLTIIISSFTSDECVIQLSHLFTHCKFDQVSIYIHIQVSSISIKWGWGGGVSVPLQGAA